jgi:hypothetical protein
MSFLTFIVPVALNEEHYGSCCYSTGMALKITHFQHQFFYIFEYFMVTSGLPLLISIYLSIDDNSIPLLE